VSESVGGAWEDSEETQSHRELNAGAPSWKSTGSGTEC
jgi:hypothetical protein